MTQESIRIDLLQRVFKIGEFCGYLTQQWPKIASDQDFYKKFCIFKFGTTVQDLTQPLEKDKKV